MSDFSSPRVDHDEAAWGGIGAFVPGIVWTADIGGGGLRVNRRGAELLGLDGHDISSPDLVHPEDVMGARTTWMRAVREQTAFELECRVRQQGGSYRWHVSRGEPVRDATGRVVRWVGTSIDIHDRKELEAQLAASERTASETAEAMVALQAAAPVGFGFVDASFTLVHLNEALRQFTGKPIEQQRGRPVAEIVPDLWGQLEPIYRHVLTAGEPVRDIPFSRLGQRGYREWVASFYPVPIGGRSVGVGLVVTDVTERVRAEGFRAAVMGQVTDGVYTEDAHGRLTYMNDAASRMLRWSEEELRGKSMHEVVHFRRADGDPVSSAECALRPEGTAHRVVREAEEAFRRKDGTVFPVAYSSVPLRVGSRVDGISVVFRDISTPDTASTIIKVLVGDGDPESAAALQAVLTTHQGVEVVGNATTTWAVLAQVERLRPDVVLLDERLPGLGGVATAERLAAGDVASTMLVLTDGFSDTVASAAIAAGCAGAVDKRRAWVDLAGAVRTAFQGDATMPQAELKRVVESARQAGRSSSAPGLTTRERQVLAWLTHGCSNQQIALQLDVTVNTVRNHVQRILYKLGVHSRLEAVAVAIRDRILE